MKRLTALLMIIVLFVLSFSSCNKGEGIPFVTTKSSTTTVVNTIKVTIPEGFSAIDIAQRLEEKGVCSADSFLEACNTPIEGVDITNGEDRVFLLEGYIFPDTYEFYLNCDAQSALKKFIDNFNSKITDEIKAQANEMGFTVDEVLNLASIIQKECDADITECANVSSVFHNRLKSPSFPKLESDVTSFYIKKVLGDYLEYQDGVELKKQNENVRKYFDLYSTYYCKGLPAGPICNPGMKAILAALNPAETDYYYFLTDKSGESFYYASTIKEHNANGKKAGIM